MHDDLQALAGGDGVSVHTGFPNPALEHRADGKPLSLDLNRLLVRQPSSTYLFRVAGHTYADQGIYDGDIAVIDRAPIARSTDLVIAWRPGGSTIMRQHQLTAEDQPWGVVTAIIHQYRP
jgi:DNA polymerase V